MYSVNTKVQLLETGETVGTGWLPPVPDSRDYTPQTPKVAALAKKLGITGGGKKLKAPPPTVDLRAFCSPIENQGQLGSCTANAGAGVIEYSERRAQGQHIDASRLFIYKTTRNLMGVTGDTGAWLRNVMGALSLCGVAAERYWPYTDHSPEFDKEPPAFVYAIADNYEALTYFCHDPIGANVPGATVLASVKSYLTAGIPSMFGFWGYESFNNSDVKGGIPYPCPGETVKWGHAIVAVGYDDAKKIKNTTCNKTTTGALLIRNSWGPAWGDQGYGWMPYDYVINKVALDFWSLLSEEWLATGQFHF